MASVKHQFNTVRLSRIEKSVKLELHRKFGTDSQINESI